MNPRSLTFRISPLVVILALSIACTKAPNDAKLTSDIQAKLSTDSGLQNKQLTVQASQGTVTLSGTVDNDAEREAASRYAASQPGVKQVINNLQVAPSATEQPSAAESSQPSASSMSEPPSAPSPAESNPSSAPKPSSSPKRHHHQQQQRAQGTPTEAPASTPPASAAEAAQAPASTPEAAPTPPPEPQKVTIPSGTSLAVRLVDALDSATAQTGDRFHATLDVPLSVDGEVVVPARYDVEGHIVNAQSAGKFAGRALLELELDRIKVGDRWYNIQTDHFKQETGARGRNTAEKVGGGAAVGAILGGIFGGGKGAAIGSVAGAGAGGGVQAASKKPEIKLSSERLLNFTLQAPVTVVPTTKPARGGRKLDTNDQQ